MAVYREQLGTQRPMPGTLQSPARIPKAPSFGTEIDFIPQIRLHTSPMERGLAENLVRLAFNKRGF